MSSLYIFLTGPAFIVALLIFIFGMLFRLVRYFAGLNWKLDRVAYRPGMSMGMRGGLYSIFRWVLPFGTHGWRSHPFFAFSFLLLHIGIVLVPLFLIGHNVILKDNFGFGLPTLPQWVANTLTLLTIIGAVLIILRRIALPEVRIVTTWYDYFIILLAVLPFITGFIAMLHLESYNFWIILHIICGEIMLILAPFTKLSHIVLFFASRWQLGADFSIKRGGHRRGPSFPW